MKTRARTVQLILATVRNILAWPKAKQFSLVPVTILALAAAIVIIQTQVAQAQAPFQANGRTLQTPPLFTPPPTSPSSPPELPKGWETLPELDKLKVLGEHARALSQYSAAANPGFPVRITDVQGYARGAVVVDSTRLDPNAQGLFLPSAIPTKGEAFYGSGERATVQGQGSSVGFGWLADLGSDSIQGATRAEVTSTSSGDLAVIAPQAWLTWRNVIFGLTDSAFTDLDVIPDTIDLGGPNARTWIRAGQAQIRYTKPPENAKNDPSGFYWTASVEAPGADVYLPTTAGGAPSYSTFSRFPDFVATVKYQSGEIAKNPCTQGDVYNEFWHLQFGSVIRDLGVERSDNSVREETTGWGTQLSGQYTIYRNPCQGLRDFLYFSATYGNGISHYINDLHLVNPVNDAAYDWKSNTITPLPVFGFYAGITHEWLPHLRSTAVYSHVELDSEFIPAIPTGTAAPPPYRRGDYMSINLMYHDEPCVKDPTNQAQNNMLQHHFVAGLEYLFGQKEDLSGAFGEDHRVMFMVGAAN